MIYITSTIENMNLLGMHLLNVGFIYTCRSISSFHPFSTPGKWLYNSFPSRKNGHICIIVHLPPRKYGYKICRFLLLQPNLRYRFFFLTLDMFQVDHSNKYSFHSVFNETYFSRFISIGSDFFFLKFILFSTHPSKASDTTYN